jgi:hypothetical protein
LFKIWSVAQNRRMGHQILMSIAENDHLAKLSLL